jgi:hypothetical protein
MLLCLFVRAQDEDKNSIIEQRIESMVEALGEDDELDYTTLFDNLMFFFEHPLNINDATVEDLQELQLLDELEVNAIVNHISKYGALVNYFELNAIEGLSINTIRTIQPFIKVTLPADYQRITWKDIIKEGQSDLFLRYQTTLETQKGYAGIDEADLADNPNARYLGDRSRYYLRYRYTFRKNISFGFTGEKDPGEEFFAGTQKGFDFNSAHLLYSGRGVLNTLIIGDYQARFGQGLTMWSGLSFGKSSYVMQVKRVESGLRPYTSVDENLFMRGAAATVALGPVKLTAFYSQKQVDGNLTVVDTLDAELIGSFTSLQQSGFHRTQGELSDKDAVGERYIGGNLSFQKKRFHIGATGFVADYDAQFTRNTQLYNQFELDTSHYAVGGIDYAYGKNNWSFFGETSISDSKGIATVNGIMLALHPKLSVAVVQRHFDKEFQNLQANVFAEGSKPANESGIYAGLQADLNSRMSFSLYYDQFKFPWMRFLTDAPSVGHEYLAQFNYRPKRGYEFYVRYRQKLKGRNASDPEAIIDYPTSEVRQNFRIYASYPVSKSLKLKSRVEWVQYELQGNAIENGFMLYQDLIFKKLEWPISFAVRYALFDTESYNARVYAYETDLLYSWSIPAYYSRGSRFYLMAKIDVYRKIDLWLRYSVWKYNDRDVISSGLNEIEGNLKSDFKAQLRWRF